MQLTRFRCFRKKTRSKEKYGDTLHLSARIDLKTKKVIKNKRDRELDDSGKERREEGGSQ